MFRDIVIPNGNEAEFVRIASRLGFKKIYFIYYFDNYNQENVQKTLSSIKAHNNVDLEIGFIVNQKNLSIALNKSKLLAAKSSDKDRLFIESKKIKLIYGFEELSKKDYLHQRASGLNHIICELANKNNIAVGLPYSALFNKSGQATSLLIGRMMQNISLCKKYKVKMVIGSFSENPFDMRSPYDVMDLFSMLGTGSKDIKNSLMSDI